MRIIQIGFQQELVISRKQKPMDGREVIVIRILLSDKVS